MILAVDIGNTHIVIGFMKGRQVCCVERISTDGKRTGSELAITLERILDMNRISVGDIDGSIVSSVVPQLISEFKYAVGKITGQEPLIVGPGIKTGLNIVIDNPAQLGSDMIVESVSAINKYQLPAVIIDMGTATTLSVLSREKQYLGGMILPGIRTSLDSLVEKTSQLQQISIDEPRKVIGTNTIDCMKSGIVYGNAAMLDGLIDKIEKELGEKCTIVATGGLTHRIIPFCRHEMIIDDDLILDGLAIIFERNK